MDASDLAVYILCVLNCMNKLGGWHCLLGFYLHFDYDCVVWKNQRKLEL